MNYVDELLPDLLYQAPDASDAALRRALQLAAQDFFRLSDLWRQELPPLMLFDGLGCYGLRTPEGTRISRVDWVNVDGHALDALDLDDIAENRERGYHITNDNPHRFLVTDRVARGYVRLSVYLYPTPETEELPDWLLNDFRTALVNSALARIYGAPGSPWFDPNLASLLANQVQADVLQGKRLINNRKESKPRTVRYGGY